jgi:hypothetical protein
MYQAIWVILIAAVLTVSSAQALTLDEIKCNSSDGIAEERKASCERHQRDLANKQVADKLQSRLEDIEARILKIELWVFGGMGRPKEK